MIFCGFKKFDEWTGHLLHLLKLTRFAWCHISISPFLILDLHLAQFFSSENEAQHISKAQRHILRYSSKTDIFLIFSGQVHRSKCDIYSIIFCLES